jgi:hypothetical protein
MSEDNNKVSIKVFHWFEKMKSNYDENVQGILKRFEQYNDSQQSRVDQNHADHIAHIKEAHHNQIEQQNKQINQFKDDITYYKQQISEQQQSIAQLNNRYDSVVSCLIEDKRQKTDIRDIFSEQDFVSNDENELLENNQCKAEENTTTTLNQTPVTPYEEPEEENHAAIIAPPLKVGKPDSKTVAQTSQHLIKPIAETESSPTALAETEEAQEQLSENINLADDLTNIDGDELFQRAIAYRQAANNEQAFLLFKQAATQGHVKAMGAMGRSFFLGEGIDENQSMGLAWLINAANNGHPQAINRAEHFQENNPDLYTEALSLSEQFVVR